MKRNWKGLCIAIVGVSAGSSCSSDTTTRMSEHDGPAMNFHRIDNRLTTGGHFVDDGLSEIKSQGVTVVLDLRDKPPSGQKERLREQGIEWINIPVVWSSPQPADFEKFRMAMRTHSNDHVMVQCQANYRASAMTYLYRVLDDGVTDDVARQDMNAVWEPEDQWLAYIEEIKSTVY